MAGAWVLRGGTESGSRKRLSAGLGAPGGRAAGWGRTGLGELSAGAGSVLEGSVLLGSALEPRGRRRPSGPRAWPRLRAAMITTMPDAINSFINSPVQRISKPARVIA